MKFLPTTLSDVVVIEPDVFGDARGFFLESWNEAAFAKAGIKARFVQDNHSRSARGVLRGLHYQLEHPQGKLVRVASGRAFDVAVDLRRASPDFGKWMGVELSGENKRMLWIPPGFGHGFLALEDGTDLLYKCTDFHAPSDEHAIAWDDLAIGIAWPLEGLDPLLSPRDRAAGPLSQATVFP